MTQNNALILPNFIIVGAMKSATTTLAAQLGAQSDIFISNPKEPNFFSDDKNYKKGIKSYSKLFEPGKFYQLRGEGSTHYTKLPTYPKTLERMKNYLPKSTKIIYMMRNPIKRIEAQYAHEWSQKLTSDPIDQAVDLMPELWQYSMYYAQIFPFIQHFGRENVLPVFMEHLVHQKQAELQHIADFLGYNRKVQWFPEIEHMNNTAARLRMSESSRQLLNNPILSKIRRAIVPQAVRDFFKQKTNQFPSKTKFSTETVAMLKLRLSSDIKKLAFVLSESQLDIDSWDQVVLSNKVYRF